MEYFLHLCICELDNIEQNKNIHKGDTQRYTSTYDGTKINRIESFAPRTIVLRLRATMTTSLL